MIRNILYFDELSSTNDEAKRMAVAGAEGGTVVVAETQTGGRGRRGRVWQSDRGDGIYFSIIFNHRAAAAECQSFTLAAAVALRDAISGHCGVNALIKWPNDIILDGKKLCGILVETGITDGIPDFMILGVGINVNNPSFTGELRQKATSLFLQTGAFVNKEELFLRIIGGLDEAYEKFKGGGFAAFIDAYRNNCINIGLPVSALKDNAEVCGEAVDVTESGELVVQTGDGERVCIGSGEVISSLRHCVTPPSKREAGQ